MVSFEHFDYLHDFLRQPHDAMYAAYASLQFLFPFLSLVGSVVFWTTIGRTDSELLCHFKGRLLFFFYNTQW
jgi:hypothetical protein